MLFDLLIVGISVNNSCSRQFLYWSFIGFMEPKWKKGEGIIQFYLKWNTLMKFKFDKVQMKNPSVSWVQVMRSKDSHRLQLWKCKMSLLRDHLLHILMKDHITTKMSFSYSDLWHRLVDVQRNLLCHWREPSQLERRSGMLLKT